MKYGLLAIILLLAAPGCCLRKEKKEVSRPQKTKRMMEKPMPMRDRQMEEDMAMEEMDMAGMQEMQE